MAKRRAKRRVVRSRVSAPKRRKSSGMNATTKRMIGAAAYATVAEPLFDMGASKLGLGVSDDIVKGIGGYFLAKKTTGILKGVGEAALIISVANVAKAKAGNLIAGFTSGSSSTSTTTSNSGF